jgi:hypothetical protein
MTTQVKRRKVRWIIAHFPLELFVRAAKAFAVEIEKLCPGQFDIEIHTMGSYLKAYKHEMDPTIVEQMSTTAVRIPGLEEPYQTVANLGNTDPTSVKTAKDFMQLKGWWQTFFELMKQGHFELSQTQVNLIGSHLHQDFHAIDLPYLFKNHDHVTEVLDGEIGQKISERVAAKTGVHALGYTYSGGYRIIGSTEEIQTLSDLDKKTFISFTAPSNFMFHYANVKHLPRYRTTAEDIGDVAEQGGAIETTYLRFAGKNVLKTNHSMFMTSILTSEGFMSSLTEEQKAAFKEAAHRVAKIERIWSVEDAAKYEEQAESRGVKIVPVSEADEQRLRSAAAKVYQTETLEKINIDPALVQEIIEVGNKY